MYTNELLEEKYKAQKELAHLTITENKDYLKLIEDEVQHLFKNKGWKIKYSNKKGGFIKPTQMN